MAIYPLNRSGLKLEKFSPDPFLGHDIKVAQPDKGYRFSMDPFILTGHIHLSGKEKIIDVGCGCAIMPLILATRWPDLNIIGVEIQKELSEFARQNIIDNKMERSVQIIHKDIKQLRISDINGPADIIISNPPYKKRDSGRINPNSQKAIARHEITLDLDMLFNCANRLLKKKGKFYLIFPAERFSDLINTMKKYEFSPEISRDIHTKNKSFPKRIILCAVKDSNATCVVQQPLFIYATENKFSRAYISLFNPV